MDFSLELALEALENTEPAKETLLELVKQVSVESEGSITVLYGGKVSGDISASELVKNMISEGVEFV